MDITNKNYERGDSYSDIESCCNSKLNVYDSSNENICFQDIESTTEKICCIEMINNNKIYIEFKENWTVKDVLKLIYLLNTYLNLVN